MVTVVEHGLPRVDEGERVLRRVDEGERDRTWVT